MAGQSIIYIITKAVLDLNKQPIYHYALNPILLSTQTLVKILYKWIYLGICIFLNNYCTNTCMKR